MIDLGAATDEALVASTLGGSLSAFDEIVRRHQSMISRCLYRFCPHRSDLEDLTQDTFVKAFRKLDSWQATAPFENWLRKIAYNTGYDYYRKNSRNPASVADYKPDEGDDFIARLSQPESQRRKIEMAEQARKALSLLDPEDRMLLTLQYLEELPLAEIAAQMNWGISKTKVKSFRARRKLKTMLINHGIAEETEPT